jgi:hypothetical protein
LAEVPGLGVNFAQQIIAEVSAGAAAFSQSQWNLRQVSASGYLLEESTTLTAHEAPPQ